MGLEGHTCVDEVEQAMNIAIMKEGQQKFLERADGSINEVYLYYFTLFADELAVDCHVVALSLSATHSSIIFPRSRNASLDLGDS
jgi:hypothetical protein